MRQIVWKGETLYCIPEVGAVIGGKDSRHACEDVRRVVARFPELDATCAHAKISARKDVRRVVTRFPDVDATCVHAKISARKVCLPPICMREEVRAVSSSLRIPHLQTAHRAVGDCTRACTRYHACPR